MSGKRTRNCKMSLEELLAHFRVRSLQKRGKNASFKPINE